MAQETEVPELVQKIFGIDVSEHRTIVAILFIVLLYYGAEYVFKLATKHLEHSLLEEQLNGIIGEVAKEFHLAEDAVKRTLGDRYGGRTPRLKLLSRAAIRVFGPSKRQGNAPLVIGEHRIEPRIIAEVPSDAQILEIEEAPTTEPIENVKIELRAQDRE